MRKQLLFALILFASVFGTDAYSQTAQIYRHPYLRLQLRRLPATWEVKSYKEEIVLFAPYEEGKPFEGENISINGFEIAEGETCNTVYKRYVSDGLRELSRFYSISETDTLIGGKTFQMNVFTFQEDEKVWKDVMCSICVNNRFYVFLLTATPQSFDKLLDIYWDLLFFSRPD